MLNPAFAPSTAQERTLLQPEMVEIVSVVRETENVLTIWSRFTDPLLQELYAFRPGQFNMLYVPGYGEAAISICSEPRSQDGLLGHTVRIVGNVTRALAALRVGETFGIRGPFGHGWPLAAAEGKDVVLVGGGTGLPSLRPVIYHIIRHRDQYANVTVLYGARSPDQLLYSSEYAAWRDAGIHTELTVDRADKTWKGRVGVIPMAFYYLRLQPERTFVMTCGPELMIRFVVYEGLARRVPPDQIFVSLERNMKCGQGSCGHCQLGPYFVCKDGPVFSYATVRRFLEIEEY